MPEGWAWCRLNQIFNFIDYRGVTPNKIDSGVPLVTAKIEEKNSDCIASTGFYVCKPRSFVFLKILLLFDDIRICYKRLKSIYER